MVFEWILSAISTVLKFVLSIVPNIPPMPQEIVDGGQYFIDLITGVVGLVSYLYSPLIAVFCFTAILVILNFEAVYHFIMWIVRKLPIGSS